MFQIVFIYLFLSFLSGFALAQNPGVNCPSISVTGPPGIPSQGELQEFVANVTGILPKNATFKWSVNTGKIVSGQGTKNVKILHDHELTGTLTVTFEISGLSKDCQSIASETAAIAIDWKTYLADQHNEFTMFGDLKRLKALDLTRVKRGIFSIYYIVGSPNTPNKPELEKRIKQIQNYFEVEQKISHDRIKIFSRKIEGNETKIYFVPLSDEPPECDDCKIVLTEPLIKECPTIEVVGPAGVSATGTELYFTANLTGRDYNGLAFEWSVSGGKIETGQGKPSIRVSTSQADNLTTLKANVKVLGLASQCANTAEGEPIVENGGDPIMLDEFGRMTAKGIRERLDAAASSFNEQPTWVYYLILYFPETGSPKRIASHKKLIRDHLIVKRKIPAKQLVVLSGGTRQTQSTQIYFFPSQTPAPIP